MVEIKNFGFYCLQLNKKVKKYFLFIIIFPFLNFCTVARSKKKWNEWSDARSVLCKLRESTECGLSYFSQFHVYDVRGKNIHSSKFREQTGEIPYIYALDFYYASGTYFNEDYIKKNKANIVEIVKKQWIKNKAIPSFSWHLENPYVPSEFGYMGCRYRYGHKTQLYPEEHRYVIKEILTNSGDICGFGSFKKNNDHKVSYKNPKIWFDERCKEVAEIINELVDEKGTPIPMIFRLWHECEDSWMWWGASSVSKEDYKSFFILTEKLIKKYAPKSQILWAYCPERNWQSEDEFMSRYPGDKYVDIIGYDDYQIGNPKRYDESLQKAKMVTSTAKAHGKVAALFETANTIKQKDDVFFSHYLLPLIQDPNVKLGIVQMWCNGKFDSMTQFEDRKRFLESDKILMIK